MRTMKKLATWMMALCLMVSCFSMVAYAADGKIMFTDPQTKAGERVEIKGVVERTSGNMGKIEITMTYDTAMLKFISGDGVSQSEAGKITYSADVSSETGRRKEFVMKFDALKAGTTKLEIASATVKDVSGNTKDYTKGSSTIKIAEGEGTSVTIPDTTTTVEGATVEVNGKTYTISNTVPENEIPKGYVASTLDYDLVTYNVVQSESSGLILAYLIGEDNIGDFFMYVEDDATFAPYEAIEVSDTVTIALLTDVSEIELPEEYEETTVVLGGKDFPAWRNVEEPDYCILYAIKSNGEKSLYQFDNAEGTYQRFAVPEIAVEENHSLIGKLSGLLENHLDYVILGTGLGFLFFVLIIIVLSVKLYNRNAELDEIYDEYGIDEENDETEDDVVLNLDDDEEEDDDYDAAGGSITFETIEEVTEEAETIVTVVEGERTEEGKADPEVEVEFLVQQGLKDVFPEIEESSLDQIVQEKASSQPVEEEDEEVSIGKVLEQAAAEEKEEFYDDDELFENFSIDFIDLDD